MTSAAIFSGRLTGGMPASPCSLFLHGRLLISLVHIQHLPRFVRAPKIVEPAPGSGTYRLLTALRTPLSGH